MALEKLERNVIANLHKALDVAGEILFKKVLLNASLTDHTLEELAEKGHPYSTRAPQPGFHTPIYQVHVQDRTLFQNIKIKREGPDAVTVGVEDDAVPYLDAVIYGTDQMIGRPFITESLNEVKKDISDTIEEAVVQSVKNS